MFKAKVLIVLYGLIISPLLSAQANEIVQIRSDIELEMLSENVYRHISYIETERWGRIGANGMVYLTNAGAILVDTPWDNDQTKALLKGLSDSLNMEVIALVVTHSHNDCAGGIATAKQMGIETFGLDLTGNLLKEKGEPLLDIMFSDSLTLSFGDVNVELFYPGEAHTRDNIVVWLPAEQILYGGCAVKNTYHKNLGNTADANVDAWPETIRKLQKRYSVAVIVIPGHGTPGGVDYLSHTLTLLSQHE